MSHGHNKHKGFSQTSKRYDGDLKEQHRRARSTQHSTVTARSDEENESKKDSNRSNNLQGRNTR
jgi:hypothetical protein